MKTQFVTSILQSGQQGAAVTILGWIASIRTQKHTVFMGLEDSTGSIQVVIERDLYENLGRAADQYVVAESSVRVSGTLIIGHDGRLEILASGIEIIGGVDLVLSPRPRELLDVSNPKLTEMLLRNRHLYIRNSAFRAITRFRHHMMREIHSWFDHEGFTEIVTPIITTIPLYDPSTAFSIDYFGEDVFLSQCSAFHLESAVMALERVYGITPSFRAERSKSKRHLAEYWHLKAEVAHASLPDMLGLVERMLVDVVAGTMNRVGKEQVFSQSQRDLTPTLRPPLPRITYRDALGMLKSHGVGKKWGVSLSQKDLGVLASNINQPFWLVGEPVENQPFMYEVDDKDPMVTKTADLIADGEFGEILGVAQKVWKPDDIAAKLATSRKDPARYGWYSEISKVGTVPHSGLGMGIERLVRWLLRLDHVRDAIPFPRLYSRRPIP